MRALITGLFIVLLLFSALFAVERILFADASFILFRIINQGSFQIQELRFGSFITQMFPLIAARLHLPLKALIFLYSVSFNLFYLGVILLLLYRFKTTPLALLMSFYYILFASDTFYWSNNEVHQSIAWMFLLFAFVMSAGQKQLFWPLRILTFFLLASLAIFTHPLAIFPAVFLWLFWLVNKKSETPDNWKWIYTLLLITVCVSKLMLSRSQSYDGQKLEGLIRFKDHIRWDTIQNAFRSPVVVQFFKRCITNYWVSLLVIGAGLYFSIRQKKYYSIALIIAFALAYTFALGITYNDFEAFYSESEWMPLTIIIAAPFIYYALPLIKPKIALCVIALAFMIRLLFIYEASEKFVARKDWYMATLTQMRQEHITKAIITETTELKRKLLLTWATPVESMIASALDKDIPTRSFIITTPDQITQIQNTGKNQVLTPFETLHYNQLNNLYFVPDTTTTYTVLNLFK